MRHYGARQWRMGEQTARHRHLGEQSAPHRCLGARHQRDTNEVAWPVSSKFSRIRDRLPDQPEEGDITQ